MEVSQINKTIEHEIKNTMISCAAILFIVFSFLASVSFGYTHLLSKLTDSALIQLGLMPEHMIPKLVYRYAYSYKYVNIVVFVILNTLWGYISFKLIKQRDTKLPGFIFAVLMSLILFIVGSIYTVLSGDPFNWIAVVFGLPITFFTQGLLATVILAGKRYKYY
ncbi:MAG: hypothetical protein K6T65_16640 [Peptococcaceae bacterium]|nr:hypothetical protein [Peptococcaceae bacterium]